jgi:hypothetical protein
MLLCGDTEDDLATRNAFRTLVVGETVMEAAEDDPAVWDWRSVEAGLPGQILDGQQAFLDSKELAVRRRGGALSPDAANGKLMMEIYQRRISGSDCVLAQELPAHVLEHIHGDSQGALTYGSVTEIGAVGDQSCQ